MPLKILHTNDFHGSLDQARFEKLRALREDVDIYLDNGDAIKAGNLAIPLREEPVWKRLAELRCTASVLGNRETHILETAFAAKLKGVGHPILCANVKRRDNSVPILQSSNPPILPHLVIQAADYRVGIVGVMVAMVTGRMATQKASAFLWDDPIQTAISEAEKLRGEVDVLIALTHIGVRQDGVLAEKCDLFDLILGGHSHTVLDQPLIVDGTPILQAGSHGRYAGVYEWSPDGLTAKLVPLG